MNCLINVRQETTGYYDHKCCVIYCRARVTILCFDYPAELLVDKAMELDHVGGTYGGNIKPTPFLCLVLKMLQIQPEKEIVVEFIKNEDYK